jgi:tetratricopeptide (TPR) repeat protein
MGDLLRLVSDFDGIQRLYREYAQGLSASEEARAAPFLAELGEIGREQGEYQRAVEDYTEVLRLSPDNDNARFALAELYGELPDGADKAVAQQQDLLRRDPFRVECYLALARLSERTRDYDRAFLVAGILDYLGALPAEDRPLFDDLRARGAAAPRGRLDADDRVRYLRHQDEGDGVRVWLRAMAPVAEKLCPVTAKELGARRSFRLASTAEDPLRTLLDRLIGITGTADAEIYRLPDGEAVATPFPGAAPIVVIAESELASTELASRRFLLARALALSADASALIDHHGADSGAEWTAVCLATMSDEGGSHGDMKTIGDAVRKEAESAARDVGIKRLRKYAGEQADRVRRGVPFNRIVSQLTATQFTADRVGLLAASDATVGLRHVGGPFPSTFPTDDRILALRDRSSVAQALLFLLSEEHSALRTRLGLSLR